MSRRDPHGSLAHMLDHAREAIALLDGMSREAFARDRVRQLAVTRLLEIVGESANRVPGEARRRWGDIPWAAVIGMRNRLIHGYDVVDVGMVWDTVAVDLPPLVEALAAILAGDASAG